MIADNKIALLSSWDPQLLKGEIKLLIEEDFGIETTGFSTAEIDVMFEEPTSRPIQARTSSSVRS